MRYDGTFRQLGYSIEGDIAQTALFALPEHLSEDTQDLLLEQTTEWVSLYLRKLHYALGDKYAARYFTLSVTLEKVPKNGLENATTGVI